VTASQIPFYNKFTNPETHLQCRMRLEQKNSLSEDELSMLWFIVNKVHPPVSTIDIDDAVLTSIKPAALEHRVKGSQALIKKEYIHIYRGLTSKLNIVVDIPDDILVPAPTPEPVSEPVTSAAPDPAPAPTPEPVPEPVTSAAPEPVPEPPPEPGPAATSNTKTQKKIKNRRK
jgi:outer membrane biosynthesis protein TonB